MGISRNIPSRFALIANENTKKCHGLLGAIDYDRMAGYSRATKLFNSVMEQVDLEKGAAREVFKIYAEKQKFFQFFETKQEYDYINGDLPGNQIIADVLKALGANAMANPYDDDFNFIISIPYSKSAQIPMNEILANYAVLFYLGSLVRYNPWYLDKILFSNEGLLIERFLKSAPISLLRHIHNKIRKQNFVFTYR